MSDPVIFVVRALSFHPDIVEPGIVCDALTSAVADAAREEFLGTERSREVIPIPVPFDAQGGVANAIGNAPCFILSQLTVVATSFGAMRAKR